MSNKQKTNNVELIGTVVENNVVVKPARTGKVYARGDFLIDVGGGNEVTVDVFQAELRKDGQPNSVFNQLKAIADPETGVQTRAEYGDMADVLHVTAGEIRDNSFIADDERQVDHVIVNAPFFEKLKPAQIENMEPKATFEVEAFVVSINDELDQEENETGRLIIKAAVLAYNGEAYPITFIAGVKESDDVSEEARSHGKAAVEYIRNNHNTGDTVKYSGNIVAHTETVTKEEEMEFGAPIVKEFTNTTREFQIVAGTAPYEEDDNPFNPEDIQKGKDARAQRLVEDRRKRDQAANQAAGGGFNDDFAGSVDNSGGDGGFDIDDIEF